MFVHLLSVFLFNLFVPNQRSRHKTTVFRLRGINNTAGGGVSLPVVNDTAELELYSKTLLTCKSSTSK